MPLLTGPPEQPGRCGSPVAGAAGVLAARGILVTIGGWLAAIDSPVPLDALVHAYDANAIATRTLSLVDGPAHQH